MAGDPLDAATVFRLLTSEGADAAGLGDEVGLLGPGRRADLLVLDTSGPHWHPRRMSWAETVVASATAADVRTVLVDGRVVVTGGAAVTGVDGRRPRPRRRPHRHRDGVALTSAAQIPEPVPSATRRSDSATSPVAKPATMRWMNVPEPGTRLRNEPVQSMVVPTPAGPGVRRTSAR